VGAGGDSHIFQKPIHKIMKNMLLEIYVYPREGLNFYDFVVVSSDTYKFLTR
jgi:hypothetical protein